MAALLLLVTVTAVFLELHCVSGEDNNNTQTVWVQYGSSITLDCVAPGIPLPTSVVWTRNKKQNHSIVTYLNVTEAFDNSSDPLEPGVRLYEGVSILVNGSVYIGAANGSHGGRYYCTSVCDTGNETAVFVVRLNYNIVSIATLNSIIIGLSSASAFFLIAVFIGLARYLAYVCSSKEKRKRKSIRDLLGAIHDYKSAQFDRFSAYRSAKLDQLSALKSATMGHLSAFREARVDQLRTYKQATITSILAHLERMRDHYAAQTARVKENCAMQAERLRDSYSSRRGRFKDYRSHRVDRVRENYQMQAAKIREYGMQQMSRLREQYKTQQQYVLKLVELLDVGSCVSGVIEAECMRAESMIFDADIAFDFEAQPARVTEADIDFDDDDTSSNVSDASRFMSARNSVASLHTISDGSKKVASPLHRELSDDDSFDSKNSMGDEIMFLDIDLEDMPPLDIEITKRIAQIMGTCPDFDRPINKTHVPQNENIVVSIHSEEAGATGGVALCDSLLLSNASQNGKRDRPNSCGGQAAKF